MSTVHDRLVDLGDCIMLGEVGDILSSDDGLEALCRAHDEEECAQKGEPSPWARDLVSQFICENGQPAWDEWRSERFAAMRAALKAVGLA